MRQKARNTLQKDQKGHILRMWKKAGKPVQQGFMIRSRETTAERSKRPYDKDVAKSREACAARSKRSYDKDVAKSREATA